MISLKLALLRLYKDRLGSGDSYTQVCEWQSEEEEEEEEEERWSGPCEVHLQMEMTRLLMTGLCCVIVAAEGSEYLPSFRPTV